MAVQNMQMYTQQSAPGMMGNRSANTGWDWSGEISAAPEWNDTRPMTDARPIMDGRFQGGNGQMTAPEGLQMTNRLPADVVESPTSVQEAYLGSLKAMLNRNKGNYIVATFLVGTQNTVSWEGILYDVGNDYVTIYQEGRDRYIVSDIYSLRYMEFYDVRRRELCDRLIAGQNWQGQM